MKLKSTQFCIGLFLLVALTACKGEKTEQTKTKPKTSKDSQAKTIAPKESPPVEPPKEQTIHLSAGRLEIDKDWVSRSELLPKLKANKGPTALCLHGNARYVSFKMVIQQLIAAKKGHVKIVDSSEGFVLACAPQENFNSKASIKPGEVLITFYYPGGKGRYSGSPQLAMDTKVLSKIGSYVSSGLEPLKSGLNAKMKELKGVETPVNLACDDSVPLGELSQVLKVLGDLKLTKVRFGSVPLVIVEEEVEIDRTPPKGTDMSKGNK